VRTRWTGEVVEEYVTLVNPQRDVGPTSIHGVTARDIVSAPPFEEVAGDVADRLSGAVLAGHNVDFDLRFISAELARLGSGLGTPASVCTLALCGYLAPPPLNGRLSSCCAAIGIRHDQAHSALSDAHATAQVLHAIIRNMGCAGLEELGCHGQPLQQGAFPDLKRSGLVYTRQSAAATTRENETYLSRLIDKLPISPNVLDASRPGVLAYLDLLDRALEDRFISAEEAHALVDLAREWGVSAEVVKEAHSMYLEALARAAVADGVVSQTEWEDLVVVTRWLSLSEGDAKVALAKARDSADAAVGAAVPATDRTALSGRSVCFTGELACSIGGVPISREAAEALAKSAGLIVKSGVSKKLDLLVTADPLSLSGKAVKARAYGIRIVAEAVFWRMIGVAVD